MSLLAPEITTSESLEVIDIQQLIELARCETEGVKDLVSSTVIIVLDALEALQLVPTGSIGRPLRYGC